MLLDQSKFKDKLFQFHKGTIRTIEGMTIDDVRN